MDNTKRGIAYVAVGVFFFFLSFAFFVTAPGIILMTIAISLTGYGAGTIMNSPCEMEKQKF